MPAKCIHGRRRYTCKLCTDPGDLCPHGNNKQVCKTCIYERKAESEEAALLANEVDYFYQRESQRAVRSIERNPEELERLKKQLEHDGVQGLSVVAGCVLFGRVPL